jgi:hypothetical protein
MQIKMTLDAGRVAQVVNHLTGKHEAWVQAPVPSPSQNGYHQNQKK